MSSDIIKKADKVLAGTYGRFPLVLKKGQGCRVEDVGGNSYLDFVAGIAVCNLGHSHPAVIRALGDQARELFHVSNLYYTLPQVELAAFLTANSFADRVFFCNSGAEANEAAIKLARKFFSSKGEEPFRIIAMDKSFHGRTMATLSATGQKKIQAGYEPVLPGFDFVPFNDIEALRQAVTPLTCAVMLEPVQGEGGVRCPSPGYLKKVRDLCDEKGLLLIFDEIQTGIGRTGKLFAYQHEGVEPDIMTLAKALGNGLPIGAMLAREAVAAAFTPGSHASTFGGTPIITAAALATLTTIVEEDLAGRAGQIGRYFQDRLEWLKSRHDVVEDVRGIGLLLGIKLKHPGAEIVKACMQKGFLINCVQDSILRFIPPLIISREDIDALIACLDEVL
ncbi:MAG: acetylornithine transaminase [Thermodesulfobacteriota bacterium]